MFVGVGGECGEVGERIVWIKGQFVVLNIQMLTISGNSNKSGATFELRSSSTIILLLRLILSLHFLFLFLFLFWGRGGCSTLILRTQENSGYSVNNIL